MVHFLSYNANKDFVTTSFQNLRHRLTLSPTPVSTMLEVIEPAIKTDFKEYAKSVYNIVSDYQLDYELIEKLIDISEHCKNNNINLVFVIPPMNEYIWSEVIVPLELTGQIYDYKRILSEHNKIYDMEYKDSLLNNSEDFTDGFHFNNLVEKEFIEMILLKRGEFLDMG